MNLEHLGTPLGPMTRVHGGLLNRMYRLDTDQGSFAIKELNLDRDWTYRPDDVLRFERAAFAAGIPMPEPISASDGVLVHRWVEGDKVPQEPVPIAFAHEIGAILARIHSVDVRWDHVSIEDPMPTDWPDLAKQAVATGQPWAALIDAEVDTFLAMVRFVEACERTGPVVLTHKDINQKNLLACQGRPVVLDWECAGKLEIASELGSTALNLAQGASVDTLEPMVFRSMLDGYVEAGGTLPPPGDGWFVDAISGWLWFTRWNIVRCLTGIEAANGPDLALSHETVGNGLRGLPALFARLPQLQELLA